MTACDVLIVGGGPAGLRAAELVSAAGLRTVLADHKPSVGRKFLVAGRGGLNLTHSKPVVAFPAEYGTEPKRWESIFADFSPDDLRAWAKGLGIETFVGTSRRVFPESKQAAPLLRRWIERLRKQGVDFQMRHELRGVQQTRDQWEVRFSSPGGEITVETKAVVMALGGASWPETGSDGGWVKLFSGMGIGVTPLTAANCGYEVEWPEKFLAQVEGQPVKNIVVSAGGKTVAGELLITKYGLEGGALYQLGRELRAMAQPKIEIDFRPTFVPWTLVGTLANQPGPDDMLSRAARAWKLSPAAKALLELRMPVESSGALAALVKTYPVVFRGPRPIEEAISTAGGVRWEELDEDLMLKRCPGIFCAGEMIDWDAPTGGYLLQGCFSTATRAARGAQKFFLADKGKVSHAGLQRGKEGELRNYQM